jgi:hypothetical protein
MVHLKLKLKLLDIFCYSRYMQQLELLILNIFNNIKIPLYFANIS